MQILYAAPFLLLSFAGFLICLGIRRWRRFAYRALAAPVSFGFCSVAGLMAVALLFERLKLTMEGEKSRVIAVSIYLLMGLVGSWLTVVLVGRAERRLLRTQAAKDRALRIVTALVAVPIGLIVGLALAGEWLKPGNLKGALMLSILVGLSAGVLTYFSTKEIQNHAARRDSSEPA